MVKPIYLRKNIVFLDSVVEIYKHWNTAETLVSYSGTKSLAPEWCSILIFETFIKKSYFIYIKLYFCAVDNYRMVAFLLNSGFLTFTTIYLFS